MCGLAARVTCLTLFFLVAGCVTSPRSETFPAAARMSKMNEYFGPDLVKLKKQVVGSYGKLYSSPGSIHADSALIFYFAPDGSGYLKAKTFGHTDMYKGDDYASAAYGNLLWKLTSNNAITFHLSSIDQENQYFDWSEGPIKFFVLPNGNLADNGAYGPEPLVKLSNGNDCTKLDVMAQMARERHEQKMAGSPSGFGQFLGNMSKVAAATSSMNGNLAHDHLVALQANTQDSGAPMNSSLVEALSSAQASVSSGQQKLKLAQNANAQAKATGQIDPSTFSQLTSQTGSPQSSAGTASEAEIINRCKNDSAYLKWKAICTNQTGQAACYCAAAATLRCYINAVPNHPNIAEWKQDYQKNLNLAQQLGTKCF